MKEAVQNKAQGAALLAVLFTMVAVLIAGLTAARGAMYGELAARAAHERQIAFAGAEAALADAERDIDGATGPAAARTAMFGPDVQAAFAEGCGAPGTARAGLCQFNPQRPAWQVQDLDSDATVALGSFTGAAMSEGEGVQRAPRYLVELLPDLRAGENDTRRSGLCFRITAIGFGSTAQVRVVLQAYYRKAAQGAPGPLQDLPASRLGWREVANWPALHEAAGAP